MSPIAWLVGFVLPACGADGAAGLPVPAPMDMTRIERPASPNTYLAGPAGLLPKPDRVLPPRPMSADALYAQAQAVFGRQTRTYLAAAFPERHQLHYVVRSALMNYPDLVTVQTAPAGPDQATLIIWSRSVYGYGDMGVNRARTDAWLSALDQSQEK